MRGLPARVHWPGKLSSERKIILLAHEFRNTTVVRHETISSKEALDRKNKMTG